MSKLECPACGLDEISTEGRQRTISLGKDFQFSYERVVDTCNRCKTSGDFGDVGSKRYDEALKKAASDFAISVGEEFSEYCISMASFERAFGLAKRTFARWKRGEISFGSLSLLRLLRLFPWMIEVAEAKFDPEEAEKIMVHHAMVAKKLRAEKALKEDWAVRPQNVDYSTQLSESFNSSDDRLGFGS